MAITIEFGEEFGFPGIGHSFLIPRRELVNRREFLIMGGVGCLGPVAGGFAGALKAASPPSVSYNIQYCRSRILDHTTNGLVSFSPDGPPPVIRLRQGQRFSAEITNNLDDHTAMHWHGIRLPNNMDGVPYLTQMPLAQGDSYRYEFTPQDAGTFWYHPHCMTMDQMARGLTGLLVVEEKDDPGFDSDVCLNLRDFRLASDGSFLKFYTARGAARGGTHGTVRTANWETNLQIERPAGSLVRIRVAATDTTRIYKLAIKGTNGEVIALDGHPVNEAISWPGTQNPFTLSPGQRLDLAVAMPPSEGREIEIVDMAGHEPHLLARLHSIGPDQKRTLTELSPLAANPVPAPDLKNAEVLEFVFGWSPDGTLPNNGICGSLGYNFWSINRTAWAGDAVQTTGPLAVVRLGQSYVLKLRNESPNAHPIHLHGLVFLPIRSNKKTVLANWTDTVLLERGETIEVALVADNPGDWAFHCHVIEHQKTGLAGYIRVE